MILWSTDDITHVSWERSVSVVVDWCPGGDVWSGRVWWSAVDECGRCGSPFCFPGLGSDAIGLMGGWGALAGAVGFFCHGHGVD